MLYEAIVHPGSNGFRAKSRLYGQMTDFARHLLLVRPDDDCISCSRRILGVVTGALGVIWGLDAPYEATVHPGSNGFGAKIFLLHFWNLGTSKRPQLPKKRYGVVLEKKLSTKMTVWPSCGALWGASLAFAPMYNLSALFSGYLSVVNRLLVFVWSHWPLDRPLSEM